MKKGKAIVVVSALFLAMASSETVLAADSTALQSSEETMEETYTA